jgi:DNA modification methylase
VKTKAKNKGKIESGGNDRVVVDKITSLHDKYQNSFSRTLEIGVEIGSLLCTKRKELKHGQWLPWAKKNLPFSDRTARNYIQIFQHADRLKLETASNIYGALSNLKDMDNRDRTGSREETKQYRKGFADQNLQYNNPPVGQYENQIISGDNHLVMQDMLNHNMEGKYSAIITSPGYNANFYYGKDYNDRQNYDEYLKSLLKPFPLYSQLLRTGGRVIYIIAGVVKNDNREESQDYFHPLASDLIAAVRTATPELILFNHIIWDKGGSGRDPLNTSFGSYASPKAPITRSCHENILVWSNRKSGLENIENTKPDITPEEFKEWAWDVWTVAPHSKSKNPHPCSFPSKLIERLVKFYTYPNDLILDPHGGVSITAQVCKTLNRRYTTVELNPNYCVYASDMLKGA